MPLLCCLGRCIQCDLTWFLAEIVQSHPCLAVDKWPGKRTDRSLIIASSPWAWIWCILYLLKCGWAVRKTQPCVYSLYVKISYSQINCRRAWWSTHHLVTAPGRMRCGCLIQMSPGGWILQKSRTRQIFHSLSCPTTYLMEQIVLSSLPKGGCKKQPFLISQMFNNTIPQIALISPSAHHFVCYNLSSLCITQSLWSRVWNIYECQEKFRRCILWVPQYDPHSGNLPFSLELCKLLCFKWNQWWGNFHFCCQNLHRKKLFMPQRLQFYQCRKISQK